MKDIKDYEGLYAITSCGKVWSYRSKKFLKPFLSNSGYLLTDLVKDGTKKHCLVHRLVAEAYIPNPEGLPQVNHKDEIKTHNFINNLEYCDSKYNNNYGSCKETISKKVYCEELNKFFKSAREASDKLNIHNTNITAVCRGERRTAGGYHFRYVEVN